MIMFHKCLLEYVSQTLAGNESEEKFRETLQQKDMYIVELEHYITSLQQTLSAKNEKTEWVVTIWIVGFFYSSFDILALSYSFFVECITFVLRCFHGRNNVVVLGDLNQSLHQTLAKILDFG